MRLDAYLLAKVLVQKRRQHLFAENVPLLPQGISNVVSAHHVPSVAETHIVAQSGATEVLT